MPNSLIGWLRMWRQMPATLERMERTVSALSDKLDAVNTQLTAVQADVRVLLERASVPTEDPEARAAADRLSQFVEAWDAETPDADGSDTPTDPGEPVTFGR